MKPIKGLLWICAVFFCMASLSTAFAAETFTISGTISETSTYPNMIAIDEGDMVTEVYGIRFNYLERQYNIVIETGMAVSVEAFENLCNDGTVRLKAASITVGDATIELGGNGSGRQVIGSGQGTSGSGQGTNSSGQGTSGSGQGGSGSGQGTNCSGQGTNCSDQGTNNCSGQGRNRMN